jgi:hypothetical protein
VIFLIDNGNTPNFIHRRVVEETHCYVHAVHNFQIMIANENMMKCDGKCESVKLKMGDYNLKPHMLSIEVGICDVVLRLE